MSWEPYSFRRLCREADARASKAKPDPNLEFLRTLMEPGVTLERADWEIHKRWRSQGAATSTVEALMLGLRERGTKALAEAKVQRRLGELNDAQLLEVARRLRALKPHIAKAWGDDEITALMRAREALR
jgi:hypothetical protein